MEKIAKFEERYGKKGGGAGGGEEEEEEDPENAKIPEILSESTVASGNLLIFSVLL